MYDATTFYFCDEQDVIWCLQDLAFRQWHEKGYVHCRVQLPVGVCRNCESKSLKQDSNAVLDDAFESECGKLK
jgi:hypothetical protein